MHKITGLYRLFNILSLDIAAGAMISAMFFAKLLSVKILPYGLMALGLTVWIIYTADHLRDAKAIGKQAASARHRFHQKYFATLLSIMMAAVVADTVIIFFIRKQVFTWGLVLTALVIVYLVAQRYLKFLKEIFIALLYTGGVLLPSLSVTPLSITSFHVILIIQFALTALINLLMFSWFDSETDATDKLNSFVTALGRSFAGFCIWALLAVNIGLGLFLWLEGLYHQPVLIFWSMNAVLLLIFIFRHRLRPYYRLPGDAVFLIPGIYLL
jgi:hypothetical protein